MKLRPWIPAALLLSLAGLATAGWMWTREPLPVAQGQEASPAKGSVLRRPSKTKPRLVDQAPLLTARSLAGLAETLEEQQLALQAQRLANHEVDLAFADALRRAASAQVPETPELKVLASKKAAAQAAVETDQRLLQHLSPRLAAAPESQKDALEDQLEVAKAQLELDKDELEAASENLAQVGGDPQARIRSLKEAHEAADQESARALAAPRPASIFQPGSLVGRVGEWLRERDKVRRLDQARLEALGKAQLLAKRREAIEVRSHQEKEDREAAKFWAANLTKESAAKAGGPGREQAKDAVSYLRQYGEVQRSLAGMGRRIQDQNGLAEVYALWMGIADGQRNSALHGLFNRLMWVMLLMLAAYAAGRLIDQLFHRASNGNRKGTSTLRSVVKLVVQIFCVLVIGFIAFGMPAQSTTLFGLAGAGLTVALKDFIVAFFGWFILMGRNGIRVGDWVEIRGVGGEVVEVGLLRTVVLETGSWNDAGHPTGRRVAFVNSFAIEGHFFNFTTSGQWMWDELRILVPAGQDPYPIIDGIQKLVEQQTETNGRLAEDEWRQATARYRAQAFTATPSLNLVPSQNGVEIRVRYITRANERHDTRHRLNQAVVELMHGPRGEAGATDVKAED
jgi:small-conductance mechanosensitive channel